ncbi:MAG: peptidylprolyl isomerase [Bacteroidales bacterium]|jgi:peptidyl-prolyl cis-trans isomerase B (cyclophilin B)|nr:peptidylprolyl isomerase [Bacteroidales bacterium]MDD4213197.1 peptidylprolyl isomerase [Bacteroidales bacterium]
MKNIIFYIFIALLLSASSFGQSETQSEPKFLIKTNLGDITVKLYNETPLHRDNFVKLVREGFYNGSIFHRVINSFMIQGGGAANGTEDVGYTIPAEIVPKYFHKKGALAAARMPDQVNPQKASSGSQFYIVQGKIYTDAELDIFGQRLNRKFTAQERETYKTIGGTPHLDGNYTVFGEVIEGFEIINKIAEVKTKAGDKPIEDIQMTITEIK